jgi:nickel-dependent lactate racemase
MQISLPYGRGHVDLEIPDRNFEGMIKPRVLRGGEVRPGLAQALDRPVGEPLESLCRGRKVCVLIEDDTRSEPHEEIIESLAGRLAGSSEISFLITTGSHDTQTEGNRAIGRQIAAASKSFDLPLAGIHINDCFSSDFVDLGTTSRGTPLHVNPQVTEAELYVVGADMKNHYFAGYSNALKDFLPGVCAYESIEANHSWALDPRSTFGVHPLHPDPERRANPLAADMLEAKEMLAGDVPVFTLATLTSHGKLLWAQAGRLEEVTQNGIGKVDELTSFTVKKTRHAIISPGGYPEDESLYHAQRALELTKNAFEDSGSVMLLAQCANGIAPNDKARENFYDRLTRPLPEVLESIKMKYELYSHKAYKFADMIRGLREIDIHSDLGPAIVEAAHMRPAPDPQGVVDRWIDEGPGEGILVFDDASKIAVYSK